MKDNGTATVVIPTRNRGAAIIDPVTSVLANNTPGLTVVVVDQSTDGETAEVSKTFDDDPRFRYVRSSTKGASNARNVGLHHTHSEYVLFTDDDCTVPTNWVEMMIGEFGKDPNAALVFCSVPPGPHDTDVGTIPNHIYSTRRCYRSVRSYAKSIGMSAGLAARRGALEELGGFDRSLGSGSVYQSGEDHDLAIRAIAKGWSVVETPETEVIHHGFRTYEEFRTLTDRDWFGIGAAHAKHVRLRQPGVLTLVAYNSLYRALLKPMLQLLRLRPPRGLRRFPAYWRGFRHAWKAPLDAESGTFAVPTGDST